MSTMDTTPTSSEQALPRSVGKKWISLTFLDPEGEIFNTGPIGKAPDVPIITLWWIYDTLHHSGAGSRLLVSLGFYLAGKQVDEDTENAITDILHRITWMAGRNVRTDTELDTLLSFTYAMVRHRQLTYTEAAQFATRILKKSELINTDTWRIRIARWAEMNGLPPVKRDRGRPRLNNSNI